MLKSYSYTHGVVSAMHRTPRNVSDIPKSRSNTTQRIQLQYPVASQEVMHRSACRARGYARLAHGLAVHGRGRAHRPAKAMHTSEPPDHGRGLAFPVDFVSVHGLRSMATLGNAGIGLRAGFAPAAVR